MQFPYRNIHHLSIKSAYSPVCPGSAELARKGDCMVVEIKDIIDRAHKASSRLKIPEVAQWTMTHLGQRVTAVGVGLKDARQLKAWRDHESVPSDEKESRLRLLYYVGRVVDDVYGAETARAFLVGSNPQLNDEAPIVVIRRHSHDGDSRAVLNAVRVFVEG